MIPTSFEYKKASSVAEAVSLLKEHGDDAKLLSGGHSLIPALKLRLNNPSVVVDIRKIPGMDSISQDGSDIVIGSNCTHGAIADSEVIQTQLGMVAEAASHIGDVQVRNMGTIGGSIAHADPAADWPTVLIATNAQIEITGAAGSRMEAAEDFFQGLYTTSLGEDEVITSVRIPANPGAKSAYCKFVQPASRFALVGCAVSLDVSDGTISRAQVAMGGVGDHAARARAVESALSGQPATIDTATAAAEHAAEGMDVMSDHFAGEAYRTQMAKVFARRAIMSALA